MARPKSGARQKGKEMYLYLSSFCILVVALNLCCLCSSIIFLNYFEYVGLCSIWDLVGFFKFYANCENSFLSIFWLPLTKIRLRRTERIFKVSTKSKMSIQKSSSDADEIGSGSEGVDLAGDWSIGSYARLPRSPELGPPLAKYRRVVSCLIRNCTCTSLRWFAFTAP